MAELIVRDVEAVLVTRLEQRAAAHRRSVEDEHRAILREVLSPEEVKPSAMTFEAYLRNMPDVGEDADFSRIEGTIRDVTLVD
jgi:antitoxin FitA